MRTFTFEFTTPDNLKDWLIYRRHLIAREMVVTLLLVEHGVRELVQREEMIQHKIKGLQKAKAIDDDNDQLQEANHELEIVQRKLCQEEHALYKVEYRMMLHGLCVTKWLRIARNDLDVVVEVVVVADNDHCQKGRKAGAIAPQNVGAAQITEVLSSPMMRRKNSGLV
ncbi:hypothetical protein N7462_008028 [Penicillium macrosclerotiorum]|uniref:uncharacterized protein n=1 Tax=Penicillium macrosclerotiorum TaxID=303699 RepID=UPI00254898A4|nr:uncharacterized protein N7462_008028 [Penicillium macrosclerotiorum]KAJ5679784.1 hypothetical protein N7462_008028 [Penicillium macrosclerotiorum]